MDQQDKIRQWVEIFFSRLQERTLETHVIYDEGYKFEAVDHFQANIDLNAEDIYQNLEQSILNNNLVTGAMFFPRRMLLVYANRYPEETRQILKHLFNEESNETVYERINYTEKNFLELEERRASEEGHEPKRTYIGLRFISLLLGYMHPNLYNPLKPAEWKVYARFINEDFAIPNHTSAGEQYRMYNEYIEPLRQYIMKVPEFKEIRDRLTQGLHIRDEYFHWTTQDVIFVTARAYANMRAKTIATETITDTEYESNDNKRPSLENNNSGFMALESHLEEYVIRNWKNIDFGEELTLYSDDEGNTGQQYVTDVGILDILAVDSNGDFVVIELKRSEFGYRVVGQILNYIGWVKDRLASPDQKVRGIVIVGRADKTLRSAIKPVEDIIKLKEYRIQFSIDDVQDL